MMPHFAAVAAVAAPLVPLAARAGATPPFFSEAPNDFSEPVPFGPLSWASFFSSAFLVAIPVALLLLLFLVAAPRRLLRLGFSLCVAARCFRLLFLLWSWH